MYRCSRFWAVTWKNSLFQTTPINRLRNKVLPLMKLALNAKIVASTWLGVILAINTNGGMMNRPRIRGKSVEEVKKMKVKLLIPRASYHLRVSAILRKEEIAMKMRAIFTRVLVSNSFIQIE